MVTIAPDINCHAHCSDQNVSSDPNCVKCPEQDVQCYNVLKVIGVDVSTVTLFI